MPKKNYYAVKVGKKPGIYRTWDECKEQVLHYPNAVFKGFAEEQEALDYFHGICRPVQSVKEEKEVKKESNQPQQMSFDLFPNEPLPVVKKIHENIPFAYVDGSFNVNTRCYGFGGFVNNNGNKYYFSGADNEESLASMQNVAGEILGAIEAVKVAEKLGLKNLCIYYDYKGIEEWAVGNWKANRNGTINYQRFMNSPERTVNICFKKVKGHSGVEGNEIADMLARYSTGISITKKEEALVKEYLNIL